jgi:D-alanyl-D-alanine carboxypeptidase
MQSIFVIALLIGSVIAGLSASHANPSIVVDARSGEVLHADEATRPWHPASTTKMMTAYLLLKAVQEGRITLETPLTASRNAARQRPSKIGIKPGQVITVDNALKIMMVKSANDVAVVIAENIGGSTNGFVALMNAEARRLGMRESIWTNANGWHDPRQQTSARDLAILARALWYEFPEYRGYWGIGSVQLGKKVLKNTNGLVGRYPGVVGMKTGFVCASGFNLVSMAERNGRILISVVLGTSSGPERVVASARLLDQAYESGFSSGGTGYSLVNLPKSGYSGPTNVRNDVCGPGKKAFSLSEEESDAPVVYTIPSSSTQDNSPLAILMRNGSRPAPSNTLRRANNRLVLGERELGAPLPVYLGRAPGSSASPVMETSFAPQEPEPAVRRKKRPAEQAAITPEGEVGEPIMLPGVEREQTPAAAASLAPKPKLANSKPKTRPRKKSVEITDEPMALQP